MKTIFEFTLGVIEFWAFCRNECNAVVGELVRYFAVFEYKGERVEQALSDIFYVNEHYKSEQSFSQIKLAA